MCVIKHVMFVKFNIIKDQLNVFLVYFYKCSQFSSLRSLQFSRSTLYIIFNLFWIRGLGFRISTTIAPILRDGLTSVGIAIISISKVGIFCHQLLVLNFLNIILIADAEKVVMHQKNIFKGGSLLSFREMKNVFSYFRTNLLLNILRHCNWVGW